MNKTISIVDVALLVPLLITSWILIHVMAIFGIFLSIAYPLWWLFVPKKTACLLCKAGREGDTCLFCSKVIKKKEGVSPKNLISAFLNGVLLFVFFLVSAGIVFAESQMLLALGFSSPQTVSFTIPTKGQYSLGEVFPMKIDISASKTPINAIQADIGFDPTKIQVVDISTKDSFANIFIQKDINNSIGYARLTGGLPNPGFSSKGIFATVYLKGIALGTATVSFLPSSLILANDGKGTNILKGVSSATYLILPKKISQEKSIKPSLIASTPTQATNGAQMDFAGQGKVLGASDVAIKKQQAPAKPFHVVFLENIGIIDRVILKQWEIVLNALHKKV